MVCSTACALPTRMSCCSSKCPPEATIRSPQAATSTRGWAQGLLTLLRWYGSAFPRALPFSTFSALLAGLLQAFASAELRRLWLHPYPYQSFAFIAGFMIVFRCALCAFNKASTGRFHARLHSRALAIHAFDVCHPTGNHAMCCATRCVWLSPLEFMIP